MGDRRFNPRTVNPAMDAAARPKEFSLMEGVPRAGEFHKWTSSPSTSRYARDRVPKKLAERERKG